MNRDQVEGRWDEFTARVKKQWGKLTDDEVREAEGNIDKLKAKVQQKYGDSREQVAAKFNELVEEFENDDK
jgi:uncharacterized protein YjbJ (UPF0337 family)